MIDFTSVAILIVSKKNCTCLHKCNLISEVGRVHLLKVLKSLLCWRALGKISLFLEPLIPSLLCFQFFELPNIIEKLYLRKRVHRCLWMPNIVPPALWNNIYNIFNFQILRVWEENYLLSPDIEQLQKFQEYCLVWGVDNFHLLGWSSSRRWLKKLWMSRYSVLFDFKKKIYSLKSKKKTQFYSIIIIVLIICHYVNLRLSDLFLYNSSHQKKNCSFEGQLSDNEIHLLPILRYNRHFLTEKSEYLLNWSAIYNQVLGSKWICYSFSKLLLS